MATLGSGPPNVFWYFQNRPESKGFSSQETKQNFYYIQDQGWYKLNQRERKKTRKLADLT